MKTQAFTLAVVVSLSLVGCAGRKDGVLGFEPYDSPVDAGSQPEAATDPTGTNDDAGSPGFDLDSGPQDAPPATCSRPRVGLLGRGGNAPTSNFEQWLNSSGATASRLQASPSDPHLTAAILAPFDVVVLDYLVRTYDATEASVLEEWVKAGGGLVSMAGYVYPNDTSIDFRPNALLGNLGVAYSGYYIDGPVTKFMPHPITVGLSSVSFQGGFVIADLGTGGSTRTPIALLPSGSAGVAIEAGKGRAFIWGDEWIEYDTEWSSIPDVKALWVNVFSWLAANRCTLVPTK
jgi:hypothetical protein